MESLEILPGDKRRKRILSKRLKAIREWLGFRQGDMEKISPILTEGRVRQWESPTNVGGRPKAASFLVLSQAFGYPVEYFWPALPEDMETTVNLDELLTELHELGQKLRSGEATPEEAQRYRELLILESRIAGVRNIFEFSRPHLHLVCYLRDLPADPKDLPGPEDPWDGAWVMPVEGAGRWEQVYAYQLTQDAGLPAGTVVIFRALPDGQPSKERLTLCNRNGVPVVCRREPPEGATVIGEVLLAMYQPE